MEWTRETRQVLSQCFLNTLSPLPEPRRKAEAELYAKADVPNYGLSVLRLVVDPSVDDQIRHSAAVNLKNHLKSRWDSSPDTFAFLPGFEKKKIKSLIVKMMVTSPPNVQAHLSESLTIIGKHDFPQAWQSLLPELLVTLDQANDYVSVNGVLAAIDSLFKKFRCQFKTDELMLDLKYCLDNFAEPLLELFKRTALFIDQAVSSGVATAAILRGYIDSQRLCCRIFYSLSFMDLPQFFVDHMDEWMFEFGKYLTIKYSALEDGGNGVVDELRAAVCVNIALYMEKEEDLFQKYLSTFLEAVWGLLVAASSSERLTITAIKFLTTVSTSVHHSLFARGYFLQQIFQSIVIPNVMLSDEDEELFDMNYVGFISRDMGGSDLDTRRRIACELLEGIALNYMEKVTEKISAQVKSLLASFLENPDANWKHKDCAIYLVTSLATKKAGVCSVSTGLVDVESFLESVIVPELQMEDVNGYPLLKAGALKFLTKFRNQISKPVALSLLPDVIRFIGSESNVVHSYAASCIENVFLVNDEGGRAQYSADDISPFQLTLMNNLFSALQMPGSEENEYVMRCMMQVFGVANVSQEVALPCINRLATILNRVSENPKNPAFIFYLFESVAILISRACEQDLSLISAFEMALLPILEMTLQSNVSEFFPYSFQLLAQLVDLNGSPLPGNYKQIFGLILLPESWRKSENIPALVCLLRGFLRKAPHELNQQGRLSSVLGIFHALVSSPRTDTQGFYVLNAVIGNLEYDVFSEYIVHIWVVLCERLQTKRRTLMFTQSLIVCMSLFVVKHGSLKFVRSMNGVQPGMLLKILETVWVPSLKLITGSMDIKLTLVASTVIICECLSPSDSQLWEKLLNSIVTLVSRPEEDIVEEKPEAPDFGETVGYSAIFAKLYNAGRKDEDPLQEINDPKQFLIASLTNLSQRFHGNHEPANQASQLDSAARTISEYS